MGRKFFQS